MDDISVLTYKVWQVSDAGLKAGLMKEKTHFLKAAFREKAEVYAYVNWLKQTDTLHEYEVEEPPKPVKKK
jgi:hypothetical protein